MIRNDPEVDAARSRTEGNGERSVLHKSTVIYRINSLKKFFGVNSTMNVKRFYMLFYYALLFMFNSISIVFMNWLLYDQG